MRRTMPTDDSAWIRRRKRRKATELDFKLIRLVWFFILVLTCTDAVFLRANTEEESRNLQVKAENLSPYTVPLTLVLHYVNDTTAIALESSVPEDDIVYHFCTSVNEQAGGSQVRKAAEEVGVTIETNFVVVGPFVDTQCTVLATNRVTESSGAPDGFFSMEIHLDQVVLASSNSTSTLLLEDVTSLVHNGFNRGRGGRVRFRQLLRESDSFSEVGDLEVIEGLSTPPPEPSSMPTDMPSRSPSTSPVAPTTPPSRSSMPSDVLKTPSPSHIPTNGPTQSSSLAPSISSSATPSPAPEAPTPAPSIAPGNPTLSPSKFPSAALPTTNLVSNTPSMAPTEVVSSPASKNGLSAVAIAAIVCGALAALLACFLVGFVYRHRQKPDQREQAPQSHEIPRTPTRKSGPRASGSREATPRRSNVQGQNSLVSSVPDILHLDDDHESLADTTLGEQTAGRKPPSTKNVNEMNSFEEGSVYISPSRIVPPPSRVLSHRLVDEEGAVQTAAANLGVCLEVEDEAEEAFSSESKDAADSISFEEGGTSTESRPSSSVVSSLAEESLKSGESITDSSSAGREDETSQGQQTDSNSGDTSEDASGGSEKYRNLLHGAQSQISSSMSSSRSSRSTAVADNRAPAVLDRTVQRSNETREESEVKEARTHDGLPPRSPARIKNEVLPHSGSIDSSPSTPIQRERGGLRPGSDETFPSNMTKNQSPIPSTSQESTAASPPWHLLESKNQGQTSPFEAQLANGLPETRHDDSPWKEDEESTGRLQISPSDDNPGSDELSFNSTTSPKLGEKHRSDSCPRSGGSVSSDSSDGESNPWLYDAIESTLGPRSLSADLESLSGRSGKSQRSRRSSKSQSSGRSTRGSRGSSRSRRSRGSSETSQEVRSISDIANSSYASKLKRLENQLARLNYVDDGRDVSSATTSVDTESAVSKSSSTRASDKQRIIVVVPPGKLGVILANRRDGRGTVISDIRPTSILNGRLVPGDKLVAIDGVDVTNMVVSQITSIMATKSTKERQLTVVTSAKLREHAGTPQTQPVSTSESDISSE